MKKVGSPFSEMQVSFIQFGEETGSLDKVCGTLASHSDREISLQREVMGAMVYPLFLLFIAMMGSPLINAIASQQSILSASSGLINSLLGFLAIIAGLFVMYKISSTTFAAGILVHVPFLGGIFQKLALCRFARAFGVGLAAGVPLRQSLETSIKVTDNPWLQKQLAGLKSSIAQGKSLGDGLRTVQALPSTMREMIAVGESSGKLSELLEKTAVYFEDDARHRIKILTKLLPIFVFLPIAIYVGYVVVTFGTKILSGLDAIK
jgi:type IV pilus assembly protein PilC